MERAAEQDVLPLAGFTVATTAERRREELISLLQRRGARVVSAPALRLIPLSDDEELLAATRACIDEPLDLALITTGIGLRSWLEAADGWGLGERAAGTPGRRRGCSPAAPRPAARSARPAWWRAGRRSRSRWPRCSSTCSRAASPESAIAVQLHGEPLPELVARCAPPAPRSLEVPVYRWLPPLDVTPVRRLVEQLVTRAVDGIVFTSGPAVTSLLDRAGEIGRRDDLLDALRTDVVAFCIGPVTGARLEREQVPTLQPERSRLGALVREVVTRPA